VIFVSFVVKIGLRPAALCLCVEVLAVLLDGLGTSIHGLQITPPGIEDHRRHNDPSSDDPLGRLGRANLRQTGFERGDDQNAKKSIYN
jgi:hypothetical protein